MRTASFGLAAMLAIWTASAAAAEVKVLTVGGLEKPISLIAADFSKESGNQVAFTFTNPAKVQNTLSGGVYDVIVMAGPIMDDLEKTSKLRAGSRAEVVRGGIGVAVKEGSKFPDVSTPEALKATLMAAKSIALTNPATPNGSGLVTKQILEGLGIWDAVLAKGKIMSLGPAKKAIANGEFEIGLFNASESEASGCVLAGLVPASIQRYTNYDGGVTTNSTNVVAATAFVKFLTGKAATKRWTAGHMTPAGG